MGFVVFFLHIILKAVEKGTVERNEKGTVRSVKLQRRDNGEKGKNIERMV